MEEEDRKQNESQRQNSAEAQEVGNVKELRGQQSNVQQRDPAKWDLERVECTRGLPETLDRRM